MDLSARHRLSPLTVLVVLSGLTTLALVATLLILLVRGPSHSRPSTNLPGNTYITTAQTASAVHPDGSAADSVTDFTLNETIYISYTVTDAGPGTVTIKLYNNGVLFAQTTHDFPRRSTYNAYFKFTASQAGNWEADLYWRAPGATGDGTLEQRVTFLVEATADRASDQRHIGVSL